MMISRGLFGWSPPHIQPLTPVSEVSEPPESPSPYLDTGAGEAVPLEVEDEIDAEADEMEPPPAAVPFSRLFACADRLDWALMIVGSLAAAAHGTALVVYLHYFAKIIHLLRYHGVGIDGDELFRKFTQLALTIAFIAVGVFVSAWIEVSCWILTGERQTAVIRSRYVQVLLNQDMSFFDTYGNNGDIVSQVLSDVLLIQSALSEKVGNYIHNMATFFSGLIIGFFNCWQIALITLATGPVIVAAGGISNIFLHRLAENIQDAYAEAASIAEQAVSYIGTLYAFTNETLAKYSYATSLQATLRYGILISLVQGLGLGFTYGLAICSCALQLWVGRFLVTHGKAHGGDIITALFAVILSGLGLNQAATNFYSFEQGRIAAYRLFEMISRSSSTVNHDGLTLSSVQGNIEFRNVYFSYLSRPEIPILSGFYLNVPAKKAVALVGRNGSGKSSIIPLMERFYDPTLGEVLLDGENIKNLKLEWLRSQIGLVTQEPALLSLSIKDNIAYGRNASLDQIEEAAKIAHAHTFISSLDKGYDTQVGRACLSMTEEQKIKLSVARAVLSNPSILLLDEVTGGLDFEAERSVQEALDLLMLGRSTIIIARRLSLIKNADYIAVMEEGQLVEMGTHEELINLDGLYAELLKCEEATKLPRRMPMRTHKENVSFQIEKDSSASHSFQEPSSPKMVKSPSLQRASGLHMVRPADVAFHSQESPRICSPPVEDMIENGVCMDATHKEPTIKRQDSFEMRLPELPKIDVHSAHKQTSASDPESPVSPLLTSDPKNERSHSQTFSRPPSQFDDVSLTSKKSKVAQFQKEPSFWRLVELSLAEWLYAVLGSTGAAIFGSFNPVLAYVIALTVTAYYRTDEKHHRRQEIDRWCLIIAGMGIVTVIANFLQHFYFGIMGEKMTERVRRMMFSAMLRNEVGWFDLEENSADNLSMRLANDATFVRAAFSNRLSIFIQDSAAVIVAVLIGMFLHWRLALVALATLPILTISAIAQIFKLTLMDSDAVTETPADIRREILSLEAAKSQIEHRITSLQARLNTCSNGSFNEEQEKETHFVGQLSADMIYRYSRHLLLPLFGVGAQANLLKNSVLVIGAGGLGSPALLYLAACGVGRIGIVDHDVVELNNLHRQIIHTEAYIGRPKVESAAAACRAINSTVQIVEHKEALRTSNALEIMNKYDIVVDATDNVPSRYMINDCCVVLGKPLVSGAALGLEGQLTVYNYKGGPCYRCLFPTPPPTTACQRCADSGVLGVVPGIIGCLQALEAIKVAGAVGEPLSGRMLLFDALTARIRVVKIRGRSLQCEACGEAATLTPKQFREFDYEKFTQSSLSTIPLKLNLLPADARITSKECNNRILKGEAHVLLDVRPSHHYKIISLPNSLNIPLANLEGRLPEISTALRNKEDNEKGSTRSSPSLYVICRRGNDSQRAVQYLHKNGYTSAKDIIGGLESWAHDVDPKFPTY